MIARRSVMLALLAGGLAAGEVEAATRGGGGVMTLQAEGTFEVKLLPQAPGEGEEASIGRMLIDKRFHGGPEATSKGQMLGIAPDANGSGVYVAIERVTGALGGRSGSFVLHHRGVMAQGAPELEVVVAANSGTGELQGLAGRMNIDITGGRHLYTFYYTLPAK